MKSQSFAALTVVAILAGVCAAQSPVDGKTQPAPRISVRDGVQLRIVDPVARRIQETRAKAATREGDRKLVLPSSVVWGERPEAPVATKNAPAATAALTFPAPPAQHGQKPVRLTASPTPQQAPMQPLAAGVPVAPRAAPSLAPQREIAQVSHTAQPAVHRPAITKADVRLRRQRQLIPQVRLVQAEEIDDDFLDDLQSSPGGSDDIDELLKQAQDLIDAERQKAEDDRLSPDQIRQRMQDELDRLLPGDGDKLGDDRSEDDPLGGTDDSEEEEEQDFSDLVDPQPQPIYARRRQRQIPATMGDIFQDEDEVDPICEQMFCERMWACAGGKCMSQMDRMKRNFRRNYALFYSPCGTEVCRPMENFQCPPRRQQQQGQQPCPQPMAGAPQGMQQMQPMQQMQGVPMESMQPMQQMPAESGLLPIEQSIEPFPQSMESMPITPNVLPNNVAPQVGNSAGRALESVVDSVLGN